MSSVDTTRQPPPSPALLRELEQTAERFEKDPPQDVLRWAVDQYAGSLSLACSFGMQSVVIIDMLAQMNRLRDVEVFYLDTGVLFDETHQTRLRIQSKYKFRAKRVAAELSWEDQQKKYGGHLYERGEEGVRQCCYIRKVEPTNQHLKDKSAWITGMRRTHSKGRAQVPIVMWDSLHKLVKINPVATIDDATLWGYIKANDVPYNPLYDQGYPSIGCNTPVCTRPVTDGEDPRSGRWSGLGKTECGMHLDGQQIKSLDGSQL